MSTMQNDPLTSEDIKTIHQRVVNDLLKMHPHGYTWIRNIFQLGVFKKPFDKNDLKSIEMERKLPNGYIRKLNIDCRVDFGLNANGFLTFAISNSQYNIGGVLVFEEECAVAMPMITPEDLNELRKENENFAFNGGKLYFAKSPGIDSMRINIENMCCALFAKSVQIQLSADGSELSNFKPDANTSDKIYVLPDCKRLIEKMVDPYIDAMDEVYNNFYEATDTEEEALYV